MNIGILFLIHLGVLLLGAATITEIIAAYKNRKYFRFGMWVMISVNMLAMSVCILVYMLWFME